MSALYSPALSFSGDWIRSVRRPLVYVWRRGSEVLYIGVGTKGISRPLGEHHRLVPSEIEDSDCLDLYLFDDPNHASDAERALIEALQPSLNKARVSVRYQSAWETNLRHENDRLRFENEMLRYKADTLERSMLAIAENHGPSVVSRIARAALARLQPDRVRQALRRLHSEFC